MLRGFFPGSLVFLPPQKPSLQIPIQPGISECGTAKHANRLLFGLGQKEMAGAKRRWPASEASQTRIAMDHIILGLCFLRDSIWL